MKVYLTITARAEFNEILAITSDNSTAALAVALAIKTAVLRIGAVPLLASRVETPGIYMKIARPYNYLLFYRINGNAAFIQNV